MSETQEDSQQEMRLLKGTVEHPPERQIRRGAVIDAIRDAFERFGFSPLETPILSYFETLALKYEEGDPIREEIFHVTDRGRRNLGLRYDLTVPLCRFVGEAAQGHFTLPFKRYEIGKVFRDGPIKLGRQREFMQCDADTVGANDPSADAECLAVADFVFRGLGLDAEIELNNRKILWGAFADAGLDQRQQDAATIVIDKWDKIGRDGVVKELLGLGLEDGAIAIIEKKLALPAVDSSSDALEHLKILEESIQSDIGRQGVEELRAVLDAVNDHRLATPVRIVPRLARGLGIYTGTVFEFFMRDRSLVGSSIGSGGRYDRIIGEFLHPDDPARHEDYPCVGLSFGVEPIAVALDAVADKRSARGSISEVLVLPMEARGAAFQLAAQLRERGVRTEIDFTGGRLKRAFKRANALGIPYLVICGPEEMEAGEVSFKDMDSGQQTRLPLGSAADDIALRCGIVAGDGAPSPRRHP